MLTRYNSIANMPRNSDYNTNNIEKYLREEIDTLLASSANQLNEIDINELYIHNDDAERFLSIAQEKTFSDRILYLVGLVGSGKSMILNYVFKNKTLSPHIYNSTLVIPFSFDNFYDGIAISDEGIESNLIKHFSRALQSACDVIIDNNPHIISAYDNENSFYEYIKNNRGNFAQPFGEWPRPKIQDILRSFSSENPIPFYALMLKFCLSQDACGIDNVVLIVDDVEGVGEQNELRPIEIANRIFTCLENSDHIRRWSVNLIIGCRNYVYRLLNNNGTLHQQHNEAYASSDMFHLDFTPSIKDIVEKRSEEILKLSKGKKWETALNIIVLLITKIDSSVGDFLLNLKIRNMRKALLLTKKIVYNKQWIQRDYVNDTPGAFTINSIEDYNVTYATLLRAIGMKESTIYNSEESDIPNIMWNKDQMDLYTLLVLKYCLIRKGQKYSTWNDSIDIDFFYKSTADIFGQNNPHLEYFKKSTEYLILHRLLLRSIDQLQDNALPINEGNVEGIKKVYISNAAVDLWELLGKNSVLFEMYTDDLWLDNSNRTMNKKIYRGFDEENFEIAVNYTYKLFDIESKFRNHAYNINKMTEYYETFGKDFICSHLLNGLSNSLYAFYKEDVNKQEIKRKIDDLKNKIESSNRI